MTKKKIILASGSPRRQEMLRETGFGFTACAINADESFPDTLEASSVAEYLAVKKSNAYPAKLADDEVLITSDTVVILNDEILGKPEGPEEAKSMLRSLSGKRHKVMTGVCVRSSERYKSFASTTKVDFKELSDTEIDYYVEKYKPFDKAGAYGIQEWIGKVAVTGIEGSFYNVMGLPIDRLYKHLLDFGCQIS
ncbi:Maf family nucleotide pyrophosphatase [Fulvitalea axinellae]